MVVNKGLTIKNIVFLGFDMHMSNYSCIDDFCCWPNPEVSLFNSSHLCYLERRSMVSKNESFLGFLQISTLNKKKKIMNSLKFKGLNNVSLTLQNISMKYFNAFQNIRSFIYVEGNSTQIILNNVTIDQMFLPQSLIFIENSYDLHLSISNFSLSRYNMFQVYFKKHYFF